MLERRAEMTSVAHSSLWSQRERGILQMSQRILFRIGRENENIPFMNFDRIALYSSLNKCYFSFCILCKFLLSLPNVINLSDFTVHQPAAAQKCQFSSLSFSVLTGNILIEQILAKWIGYFQVKIFSCFNVEKHFHPVLVGNVLWWKFNMSYYIW